MRKARLLLLLLLWLPAAAWADTATVQINFLPLDEAVAAAKSQLSPSANVTTLPSRRLLIISDSPAHIRRATALIRQLDQPPQQYRIHVEISERSDTQRLQAGMDGLRLPGGWIRAELAATSKHGTTQKRFSLIATANRQGEIEVGTLQPLLQRTWQWLAGYGVIATTQVELAPVTSGFHVMVSPAGSEQVHVRITPWARRNDGTAIALAGASTALTLPLNRSVTIAATSGEADNFGAFLLGARSEQSNDTLLIKLTCEKY